MKFSSYILISACRNESEYIEGLIQNISAQSVSPIRMIVVDDSSSDDTFEKALKCCNVTKFLKVVKNPSKRPGSFASQAYAANLGYEILKSLEFDFVGFIDADIRLELNYYEELIRCLNEDDNIGLVGGSVIDQYKDRVENIRRGSEEFHVPGGVQFFRRECFESIGGYIPVEGGGQDTIADIMVMMKGWEIRTITRIKAIHLRPDGSRNVNIIKSGMNWGKKFYLIGYHPTFFLAMSIIRLTQKPIIFRSLFQLIGYVIYCLKKEPRPVSIEFVKFLREQQLNRLMNTIKGNTKNFLKQSCRNILLKI